MLSLAAYSIFHNKAPTWLQESPKPAMHALFWRQTFAHHRPWVERMMHMLFARRRVPLKKPGVHAWLVWDFLAVMWELYCVHLPHEVKSVCSPWLIFSFDRKPTDGLLL
jgi:hypothetical protein